MNGHNPLHAVYHAMAARLGSECESINDVGLRLDVGDEAFTIIADNADPSYVSIGIAYNRPAAWGDEERATQAAQKIDRTVKCVKMAFDDDHVAGAVELFVSPPSRLPTVEHLCAVVPRAITVLHHAFRKFREEMTLAGIADVTAADDN